jgi:hypothetical protein
VLSSVSEAQTEFAGHSMTMKKTICWFGLIASSLIACSKDKKQVEEKPVASAPAERNPVTRAATSPATTPLENNRAVKAELRNVMFRLDDHAAAHLEFVAGELVPTGKNEMPVFDDKTSFEMRVKNGKITITAEALTSVLNDYVFARSDAPLKELSVSIENDLLHVKGKLHSKGDIPFETAGTLSVNPDGRMRVNTEKVKALHVPVKGVMRLFGLELANLLNTSKIQGIETDKNDLIVDLSTLLPPPHLKGKINSVKIEGDRIMTYFGDGAKSPSITREKSNYIYLQGHAIHFGKLTMENTDLTILDMDPEDPLDWYQDHYQEQLAAGYSRITLEFGLRSYVKDYGRLERARRTAGAVAASATKN